MVRPLAMIVASIAARALTYVNSKRYVNRMGAAIAVRMDKFNISKLNIPLPRAVEVVCGLLKPKVVTGKISAIIVCCFYSPPRSKKNRDLITVFVEQTPECGCDNFW